MKVQLKCCVSSRGYPSHIHICQQICSGKLSTLTMTALHNEYQLYSFSNTQGGICSACRAFAVL